MTYLSAPTYCTNFPVRIEKGGKKSARDVEKAVARRSNIGIYYLKNIIMEST